jgi:hypothetical protein
MQRMGKQPIIDSVLAKVTAAGFTPTFISKPDDGNVIVKFADTKPPFEKTSVVITGEVIDRYAREAPAKLEEVVKNHVRHVILQLDNARPAALQAEARRIAEGR